MALPALSKNTVSRAWSFPPFRVVFRVGQALGKPLACGGLPGRPALDRWYSSGYGEACCPGFDVLLYASELPLIPQPNRIAFFLP